MIKTERCKACDRVFGKGKDDSDKCPNCGLNYKSGSIYPQYVLDAIQGLLDIADAQGISVAQLIEQLKTKVNDPRNSCSHTEDDGVLFVTKDGVRGCVKCGWRDRA